MIKNILFTDVFPTLEKLNERKDELTPSVDDVNQEEWVALIGRYGSSHIRYSTTIQFECMFFTILYEALDRLRVKLRVNKRLRTMEEEEALSGEKVVSNQATNPDTEPSTEDFDELPYINGQTTQKGTIAKVKGLYEWKHSVGGQAYNEFLDGFRSLFRVVLIQEEVVYEQ